MVDLIAIFILVILLGCSISYIVKEKKKGAKCIGCSMSGPCPKCAHKKS